jgi:hypothetical protein
MNSPDVVSVVTEDPGEADLSQLGQLTGPKSCWILVPEPVCFRNFKSCNSITEQIRTVIHLRITPINANLSQCVCISVRDQFCVEE